MIYILSWYHIVGYKGLVVIVVYAYLSVGDLSFDWKKKKIIQFIFQILLYCSFRMTVAIRSLWCIALDQSHEWRSYTPSFLILSQECTARITVLVLDWESINKRNVQAIHKHILLSALYLLSFQGQTYATIVE